MKPQERTIRIMDRKYSTRFVLNDGDMIYINGVPCTVQYIDPTHFAVASITARYIYHICEFAERGVGESVSLTPPNHVEGME